MRTANWPVEMSVAFDPVEPFRSIFASHPYRHFAIQPSSHLAIQPSISPSSHHTISPFCHFATPLSHPRHFIGRWHPNLPSGWPFKRKRHARSERASRGTSVNISFHNPIIVTAVLTIVYYRGLTIGSISSHFPPASRSDVERGPCPQEVRSIMRTGPKRSPTRPQPMVHSQWSNADRYVRASSFQAAEGSPCSTVSTSMYAPVSSSGSCARRKAANRHCSISSAICFHPPAGRWR